MGTYHSHVYPTPQGEFMAMVWADMDGMQYPVCECYRKSDAALIADALNAYAAQQEQALGAHIAELQQQDARAF